MAFYLYRGMFTMYFIFVGTTETAKRGGRDLGLWLCDGKTDFHRPLGPMESLGAILSPDCEDSVYPYHCHPVEGPDVVCALPED